MFPGMNPEHAEKLKQVVSAVAQSVAETIRLNQENQQRSASEAETQHFRQHFGADPKNIPGVGPGYPPVRVQRLDEDGGHYYQLSSVPQLLAEISDHMEDMVYLLDKTSRKQRRSKR